MQRCNRHWCASDHALTWPDSALLRHLGGFGSAFYSGSFCGCGCFAFSTEQQGGQDADDVAGQSAPVVVVEILSDVGTDLFSARADQRDRTNAVLCRFQIRGRVVNVLIAQSLVCFNGFFERHLDDVLRHGRDWIVGSGRQCVGNH